MQTSSQIRQGFLDFFKSKQHTIVPSSSLMPDAPNLLFTNAGMNQFVPIFLGQAPCPYKPGRAADTQKCIRAGGKHNDLEDVGLDTYHHTFFEMLGNWSFGDYFKKEAIEWAWELLTEVWKFPKERLYATYFGGDEKVPPDEEARQLWLRFLPPERIVPGNRKDNFWMMGDTGPCGPCSEIHVDLTPAGDTKGKLVNAGTAECIEIWNLVFIQFNAGADGSLSPLPAKHVDTGMGFERVTSIIQCTKGFQDFRSPISNYETDIFHPIFRRLEQMSGATYGGKLDDPRDIAFRVIADHVRCVGFAVADGIQPGNTDRNYVVRRILRRAVRYGRSLGFRKPFFFQLVDVLAETMGDVFPEIRARRDHVRDVIRIEEEAFNRTLDRGIDLFNEEVSRMGSARVSRARSGVPPEQSKGARYAKRRLPHFERPWGKYMVTFSTHENSVLSPEARDIVLGSLLHGAQQRYELYAACVMPDHVHLLIEPQVKEQDAEGKPVFWSLSEILQAIKSFTAHEINKAEGTTGSVWLKESFDRLIRSDKDLEEKFEYICRNPWDNQVAGMEEDYPWLWTPDSPRRDAEGGTRDARSPLAAAISGDFAFKLYDTYGFPLDLTQLMARERGLTVDTAAFEALMDEQRARARAAQKKEVIEITDVKAPPTKFVGFDALQAEAKVLDVIQNKGRNAIVLDVSPFYAEMGGQVGDQGQLASGGDLWRVVDTKKAGDAWLHFIEGADAPAAGLPVTLTVDADRRNAIQRHHTVTHLFHWALHEVVSRDASQKGSFVGPEKLTFDFNSGALTPAQVADIEKLVNERIVENAGVTWTEVPYADVKSRKDVMQFFGDKYGEKVRVVQVGGEGGALNGYSMELCGGTHVRATGEIGLFRIVSEAAIAAGIRRVEAIAGLAAWNKAHEEMAMLRTLSHRLETPVADLEKRIEAMLDQHKALSKQIQQMQQKGAAEMARQALARAKAINGVSVVVEHLGSVNADVVLSVLESLKSQFKGVIVVASAPAPDSVVLMANVSPELTKKVQAGKIIQAIAPVVGGKGGGKPEFARGGGKDAAKLDEALKQAALMLEQIPA
jgi:alanyl-tRNA synthetase/REP element-mobilizing transposase RayT